MNNVPKKPEVVPMPDIPETPSSPPEIMPQPDITKPEQPLPDVNPNPPNPEIRPLKD